jgi:hypothetical protein
MRRSPAGPDRVGGRGQVAAQLGAALGVAAGFGQRGGQLPPPVPTFTARQQHADHMQHRGRAGRAWSATTSMWRASSWASVAARCRTVISRATRASASRTARSAQPTRSRQSPGGGPADPQPPTLAAQLPKAVFGGGELDAALVEVGQRLLQQPVDALRVRGGLLQGRATSRRVAPASRTRAALPVNATNASKPSRRGLAGAEYNRGPASSPTPIRAPARSPGPSGAAGLPVPAPAWSRPPGRCSPGTIRSRASAWDRRGPHG